MLWDLNRQCFVRELPASGPVDVSMLFPLIVSIITSCILMQVQCARINDVTGEIMICRRDRVSLYTLNGSLLLEQSLCDSVDDSIMTCVFYEGVNNEWQERELLFTGHRRGVVNVRALCTVQSRTLNTDADGSQIWSKIIHHGRFELELIRQLHHVDSHRDNGANISAGISCIMAQPHVVYTGDELGRVVSVADLLGKGVRLCVC